MAESVQIALVVVFALLVGVSIPVLMSLRSLLKNSAKAVGSLQKRVGETLDHANAILGRFDLLSKELEGSTEGVRNIVTTVNELSATLLQAQRTLRLATAVAASVGPAVAAFAHALGSNGGAGAHDDPESGAYDPEAEPPLGTRARTGSPASDMAAEI